MQILNRVAWTHINGASILVTGGLLGQIKIIVPTFSMCISKLDAHNGPISSLLFHYKYSDILLTSSNDGYVKIWKLKFKEATVDIEWECSHE